MIDMESVMAGLELLADTKNDAVCEGIKCSKIAEDTIALLKEQEQQIKFLKDMNGYLIHMVKTGQYAKTDGYII